VLTPGSGSDALTSGSSRRLLAERSFHVMATVTKKRECAASTISPIPAVPLLIFTNAFFLQRYTVNVSTIKFSRLRCRQAARLRTDPPLRLGENPELLCQTSGCALI